MTTAKEVVNYACSLANQEIGVDAESKIVLIESTVNGFNQLKHTEF